MSYIKDLKDKTLNGYLINKEEAIKLYNEKNFDELCASANEIRIKFCGDKFDLCTIVNAKSGKCSENCTYCAQSSYFKTGCEVYPLLDSQKIVNIAKSNEMEGAHRFSLVASGRGLKGKDKDMNNIKNIYKDLLKHTKLHLCASFGIADEEALKNLKNSGVKTYHHNLETSKRYYSKICTTHSYDDRINTIKLATKVGLDVCSGGIFGLGEEYEDRIDMAFELRNLKVTSVPINILTPIKGTPLENVKPINKLDVLKMIAIYRFILPNVYLRYAGGRKQLEDYVSLGLHSGINSALTGNFLTTTGDSIKSDIKIVEDSGFNLSKNENEGEINV